MVFETFAVKISERAGVFEVYIMQINQPFTTFRVVLWLC